MRNMLRKEEILEIKTTTNKVYSCESCGLAFDREGILTHLWSKHGIEGEQAERLVERSES